MLVCVCVYVRYQSNPRIRVYSSTCTCQCLFVLFRNVSSKQFRQVEGHAEDAVFHGHLCICVCVCVCVSVCLKTNCWLELSLQERTTSTPLTCKDNNGTEMCLPEVNLSTRSKLGGLTHSVQANLRSLINHISFIPGFLSRTNPFRALIIPCKNRFWHWRLMA